MMANCWKSVQPTASDDYLLEMWQRLSAGDAHPEFITVHPEELRYLVGDERAAEILVEAESDWAQQRDG